MGRLLRPALLVLCALALAAALTLTAAVTFGGRTEPSPGADRATAALPGAAAPSRIDAPAAYITSLRSRLRATPGDSRSWSSLVLAYVEQARVTADPSYYAKADEALGRATALAPSGAPTQTARAALAAARHDFDDSLKAADAAIDADPRAASAWAIRADALTELGRYDEALGAARRADNLRPGPSTFARLSYAFELRGDLDEATRLMRLSRNAAGTSAASYAFASYHLGELARISGEPRKARLHYVAAIEADPSFLPAVAGRARMAVVRGETVAAEKDYLAVVRRLPLPEYLVELGELYLATGRVDLAEEQFAVARATAVLAEANGVQVDLESAIVEADHGSPQNALAAARTEWRARKSIFAADALAWALHVNGRDREALRLARAATRLGTRDARMIFHRGAIEAALGLERPARRHLRASLDIDGGVAPWREQQARDLLRSLDTQS